eukprot:CAMPEP_0117435648 /NCGR_PEP_ID=MMETSP0759-20121206/590_1 /TAXON_ID=63605 /ORGANISM="Percolomonas cosmopolitus, Strain WS" /LENGTH=83 /DNA_ID=CAMNT_0005227203 /DNA_START=216 /DNA_END=463 /DNA_ORIENTATION=+
MDWYREVWREFDTSGKGFIEWQDMEQCVRRRPSSGKEHHDQDDDDASRPVPFRELLEESLEEFGSLMKGRMNFREFCEILERG